MPPAGSGNTIDLRFEPLCDALRGEHKVRPYIEFYTRDS